MVVVPKPAVKGGGALLACAIDRAVGPAGDERADEALRLAVRLRAVRTGAQMADAEAATGPCVRGREVGAAVVGEQALDPDPVPAVEGNGTLEDAHRRLLPLLRQHLGVG